MEGTLHGGGQVDPDSAPDPAPDAWAIEPAGGDTNAPRNLSRRLAWIEASAGPLAGRRILDGGCGAGSYVRALERRGADARGIELDAQKVRDGVRRDPALASRVAIGDLENTAFADRAFDVVILNEVIEHVPDERRALAEAWRLLRPGGRLLVLAPNRLHPFETHGVHRRGGRRLPHWLPFVPWVPLALGRRMFDYWARNYWPWELRDRLRDAGFEIERGDWLWPTFENISGRQPGWMGALGPLLRGIGAAFESLPGIRCFGSSQLLVGRKPSGPRVTASARRAEPRETPV